MDGSGDANSGFCAMLLAMAGTTCASRAGDRQRARYARPNPPRGLRAGTGRGCYEATDRQSRQPPASRLGGKRRTRDRHETCSRWRAIGRLDATSSRGGAIAEVASAIAERPRSRRRLAPLCLHCRACTRGDKRTPQQRTARCHRAQQDRDPMAHAGCLRATPSVCGGRYCDS